MTPAGRARTVNPAERRPACDAELGPGPPRRSAAASQGFLVAVRRRLARFCVP